MLGKADSPFWEWCRACHSFYINVINISHMKNIQTEWFSWHWMIPKDTAMQKVRQNMGFAQNRPMWGVIAMVRDLYQIIFLISAIGGWLFTFNSIWKQTNKIKNIKDTASFILISCAWVKAVLVPSAVVQCSIADGHVYAGIRELYLWFCCHLPIL